jgi:hypothetical protein
VNVSLLKRIADAVAFPVERFAGNPERGSYERLAIPHSFKPQLSLAQAALAAGGAFLRIFLGSILFGFWGAYTYLACRAVKNIYSRGALLLASIVLFIVLLMLLLMAITALVRMMWPQRQQQQ